jgi:drug/metabolite transporter (DMT)-like permease
LAAVVNLAGVSFAVLICSWIYRQEPFAWAKLGGIGIGAAGLVLLFTPGFAASTSEILGVASITLGAAAYGWGTVLSRLVVSNYSALEISAFQMTLGGAALTAGALLVEPIDAATIRLLLQPAIASSLLYLVIVGSIVGFTLYQSLLKVWPSTRVATYAFICPIIAVLLGAVVFHERIGVIESIASLLMLLGAYAIMRARVSRPQTP